MNETRGYAALGIAVLFGLFWVGYGVWSLADGAWAGGAVRIAVGLAIGTGVSLSVWKRIRAAERSD